MYFLLLIINVSLNNIINLLVIMFRRLEADQFYTFTFILSKKVKYSVLSIANTK